MQGQGLGHACMAAVLGRQQRYMATVSRKSWKQSNVCLSLATHHAIRECQTSFGVDLAVAESSARINRMPCRLECRHQFWAVGNTRGQDCGTVRIS